MKVSGETGNRQTKTNTTNHGIYCILYKHTIFVLNSIADNRLIRLPDQYWLLPFIATQSAYTYSCCYSDYHYQYCHSIGDIANIDIDSINRGLDTCNIASISLRHRYVITPRLPVCGVITYPCPFYNIWLKYNLRSFIERWLHIIHLCVHSCLSIHEIERCFS